MIDSTNIPHIMATPPIQILIRVTSTAIKESISKAAQDRKLTLGEYLTLTHEHYLATKPLTPAITTSVLSRSTGISEPLLDQLHAQGSIESRTYPTRAEYLRSIENADLIAQAQERANQYRSNPIEPTRWFPLFQDGMPLWSTQPPEEPSEELPGATIDDLRVALGLARPATDNIANICDSADISKLLGSLNTLHNLRSLDASNISNSADSTDIKYIANSPDSGLLPIVKLGEARAYFTQLLESAGSEIPAKATVKALVVQLQQLGIDYRLQGRQYQLQDGD